MKILINIPSLNLLGGVSNHYLGLKKHWSHKVKYNTIGSRYNVSGILLLPFDIMKFILKCIVFKPSVVLLNPSLGEKAIIRDAFFLKTSKWLKIKTVVFLHGWDSRTEAAFDTHPNKFTTLYRKADGFFVLANEFKSKLEQWGIIAPIHLTTTKVDDDLLSNFDIKRKPNNCNILFLARVIKEKGVYIAIDTFRILVERYPKLSLTIAGDGSELLNAQEFVRKNKIPNIIFTGKISGDALKNAFKNNSFYLFPTYYGEGMPTSVLEAMALGQVIISRPIGGIKDFFENEKMGFLIDSLEPKEFANKITYLIKNKDKIINISNYNYLFSQKHFMASKVSKNIETHISNMLNK